LGSLAPPDDTRAYYIQQDDRRTGRRVVVRGHREAVRADAGHREHIACARGWQLHRADQHVTAFAELPGHRDVLGRAHVRPPRDRRGVLGAVERGPDVVAHTTVDGDERPEALDALGPDHAVQRDRGATDDASARL